MTPEGKVLSAITAFLRDEMKKKKCYYERRNAVGLNYRKGIPDLWYVKDGIHHEVEVKKPGGTKSTLQVFYSKFFADINCKCICVDSFDQFLEFYNAK